MYMYTRRDVIKIRRNKSAETYRRLIETLHASISASIVCND